VSVGAGSPNPHDAPMARDEDDKPPSSSVEGRSDPDADVLDLVDQGKRDAALRLLMQRHGRAVYRFCREALRDEARADDVHQRVFIEAHRDLPGFARRSLVRTWLFAIARHRMLDEVKARNRAERHVDQDEATDLADSAPTAGERIDDARLREALAACVGELPVEIRTAVLMRYQQSLSFEEMARELDEKAGTLQARVARAMARLQACIAKRTGGSP
jgi:RNA polymerase sigma-70 factor, ECF subfamily